jgi:hypothetical protein
VAVHGVGRMHFGGLLIICLLPFTTKFPADQWKCGFHRSIIPADHYIINVESVDDWRVIGFIDDTAVRSRRPGSGPVGPEDGPGRPRRQHAYLIQRAFYRYVFLLFILCNVFQLKLTYFFSFLVVI